jgi:uncharacterized protein YecE (DUF72 family)
MHPIRIGTCGWSYKDWTGVFYPKELPAAEWLAYYATRYPVVEVDSTFYGTPKVQTVASWRDKTPAGFGFSLKVPQVITHEKLLVNCGAELDAFLTAARVLGDKLNCCLLQFGYFNRKVFARLGAFLERLDPFLAGWPPDVPLAVEIRNKTWLTEELLACLRHHQAALALIDQAWMPSPLSVLEKCDPVTASFAYVRLLGDRAEVDARTKTLDHIVLDRSEQIETDAKAIGQLSARVPVLTFVNNHYAGYSPETVRHLQMACG